MIVLRVYAIYLMSPLYSYSCYWLLFIIINSIHMVMVMAKGDGRDVGFQGGGCFSRFLKREQINNQTFIAFLNSG